MTKKVKLARFSNMSKEIDKIAPPFISRKSRNIGKAVTRHVRSSQIVKQQILNNIDSSFYKKVNKISYQTMKLNGQSENNGPDIYEENDDSDDHGEEEESLEEEESEDESNYEEEESEEESKFEEEEKMEQSQVDDGLEEEDEDTIEEEEETEDDSEEEYNEETKLEEKSESDEDSEEYDDDMEKMKNEQQKKVKISMIQAWTDELNNSRTQVGAFKNLENVLAAAIQSIIGSKEENLKSKYIVEDPQIFNKIVMCCLNKVPSFLHKMLNLKSPDDKPNKAVKWKRITPTLKRYLKNMILLTEVMTDATGLEVLLKKGIMPLIPIFIELRTQSWNLVKRLACLWAVGHEEVRVLALISLFRLMRSFDDEVKEKCFKTLYICYVKNCHFTSPITWPMIDFMRGSLVELLSLEPAIAYRLAFVYIRQLAVYLRNAMICQKKDKIQLVYNWPFIHCIHLWSALLGKTHPSPILQPLIYPLIQVAIGTMGLVNSPRYCPVVFHISKILTDLSHKTSTFIPILTPLLAILSNHRLRIRPKKTSMKPLRFDSIIKVSLAQLNESAFTDGVMDQLYDCLLTYLNVECASIGFPELVFPSSLKIKAFIQKCKVPSYKRKLKQLLDKITENSVFIERRRKDVQFAISDLKALKDWEIATSQASPPLQALFNQWKKVRDSLLANEEHFSVDQPDAQDESGNSTESVGHRGTGGAHHLITKRHEEEFEREFGGFDNKPKKRRKASPEDRPTKRKKGKGVAAQPHQKGKRVFDNDEIREMKLAEDDSE